MFGGCYKTQFFTKPRSHFVVECAGDAHNMGMREAKLESESKCQELNERQNLLNEV